MRERASVLWLVPSPFQGEGIITLAHLVLTRRQADEAGTLRSRPVHPEDPPEAGLAEWLAVIPVGVVAR